MQISYKMIQNLIRLLVVLGALTLLILIVISNNKALDSAGSTGSSSSGKTSVNLGSPANKTTILPPATVPPKVSECNQIVGYSNSGVPSPLSCVNGDLNINAWNAISAQEPKVMGLGYSPATSVVQAAICSDISAASSDSAPGADNALEASAYQISALYYGWNLGSASSYISNC